MSAGCQGRTTSCDGGRGELTVDLTRLDGVDDRLRGLAVNLASNAVRRSENLLDSAGKRLGEGLVPHSPGNLNDLVEGDGLVVLDVLFLLAVTGGLLQGADDEGRGGRNDGDGGLTVLDGELDRDAETLLFVAVSAVLVTRISHKEESFIPSRR